MKKVFSWVHLVLCKFALYENIDSPAAGNWLAAANLKLHPTAQVSRICGALVQHEYLPNHQPCHANRTGLDPILYRRFALCSDPHCYNAFLNSWFQGAFYAFAKANYPDLYRAKHHFCLLSYFLEL